MIRTLATALALSALSAIASAQGTANRVIAWNDLGMHCIDPDFSIFSILPPYNTLNAHLIRGSDLVRSPSGVTFTYESVADLANSINTTSIGKTNFWQHVNDLFGVNPPPDTGLAGQSMPGTANTPQPMKFDGTWNWFHADGIPITPIDDQQNLNPYPLMKVVARDSNRNVIAETITTAPNSQELDCMLCHGSGSSPFARPPSGWRYHGNALKDNRLNILRLHDDLQANNPKFASALASAGYNALGLYHTATVDGKSILCAKCHQTNALPNTGLAGIKPLTEAIHGAHANAVDPHGVRLNDNRTRNSCYTCHPGNKTQCLRGAMGRAIGSDGQFAMHCQSCHGGMSDVGATNRVGWLDQPTCQNCHSGSATTNSGQIRYTTVFDGLGNRRAAASPLFATTPDVPQQGFSLYRFSHGHGDLQCSACHGSPHAIYPTSAANDNAQSVLMQGHVGTITDCRACHTKIEDDDLLKGPHGMHPVDADWADDKHGDLAKKFGFANCQACHGANYRGTELSMAQGDRVFQTEFGQKRFWRGFKISCYDCHDGPFDDDANPNRAPVVPNVVRTTPSDVPLVMTLAGSDPDNDPLTLRIVSQPRDGTVGFVGNRATYFPPRGFLGTASFTYAARDNDTDSNLGRVTITVTAASCGTADPFGFGYPGTNDILPTMALTGCPSPGQTVTLDVDRALGNSKLWLVVGQRPANTEVLPGLMLRVGAILGVSGPLPLTGAGPANGQLSLPVPIPAAVARGTRIVLQGVIIDPGSRHGVAATNGLDVTIR